jgi:hypothetical protein
MYMFNDIELLLNLGKLGILKHVLSQCGAQGEQVSYLVLEHAAD